MSQRSDEKAEAKNQIPAISSPKVIHNPENTTSTVSEVRCPHILKNKHTGKEFRCNYKAMELNFGQGTTKCRNCRKIFSFEVNTTHVQFVDEYSTVAQSTRDVLE